MQTVFYVISDLDQGGAERHIDLLLPRLQKMGHHPVVFSLRAGGIFASSLHAAGIDVLEFPFPQVFLNTPFSIINRLIQGVCNFVYLCYCLVRYRPKVVHFFLPEAYLLGGVCSLIAGRYIRVMSRRSLNIYQLKHPFAARIEHWLHGHMDLILGNSRAVVQQLLTEGIPENRLELVYNGIDIPVEVTASDARQMRVELNIPAEALVMVMVANLFPYKGHDDLLNALALLTFDPDKPWFLLLAGRDEGVWNDFYIKSQRLGLDTHIRWLGPTHAAGRLFGVADIGILCSHQEGFSNSLLEGMAAGTPMVVTDVGGNPEAIIDGQQGFVIPPRNPPELALALRKLIDNADLRQIMGRSARDRVTEMFSIESCAAHYDRLYRKF